MVGGSIPRNLIPAVEKGAGYPQVYITAQTGFRKVELISGGLLVAVGALVMTNQLVTLNGYFSFLQGVVLALEEHLL